MNILIYKNERMENNETTIPGNGRSFEELQKHTQGIIAKSLEERQEYKDKRKKIQGDVNRHIRQTHRPDLGY